MFIEVSLRVNSKFWVEKSGILISKRRSTNLITDLLRIPTLGLDFLFEGLSRFSQMFSDCGRIITIPGTSVFEGASHTLPCVGLVWSFFMTLFFLMGWGESGFNCWGVNGPALVLFLFYVNVSGMRAPSRLSSRPLTIPAPWVLLRVRWSIRF